ncbi:MAG: hypothetical protein SVZ03_02275 [Spirochaetota bacterium]|nr:hypothetical protein [Spirochaetota bacterium]
MKEILLRTHSNNILGEELHNVGFIVKDIGQLHSLDEIIKSDNISSVDCAIIEIVDENIEELINVVNALNTIPVRIIGLVYQVTDRIRNFLINNGIADLIISPEVRRIVSYIDIIDRNTHSCKGKILILDDSIARNNILITILKRFHYKPIVSSNIDEFFDALGEGNIQLVLVSLGVKDFDINYFIKRSYASAGINQVPIIPYKDSIEGLFVHELISGLNRLAKVILSSDELYSYLIDLFFRRELSHIVGMFNESVGNDILVQFNKGSLKSIHYSLIDDIFSMDNILEEDRMMRIKGIMNSINDTLIKADGLRWLVIKDIIKTPIGVSF